MPESDAFNPSQNRVEKLDTLQRGRLAKNTADLWMAGTQQIQPLLDESIEAWRLVNENKPRAPFVNSGSRDARTAKEQKRHGLRIGHVPRSVEANLAIQHNATFTANERFFQGSPRNEMARLHQDHYELWSMDNLAEINFALAMYNHRKNVIVDGTAVFAAPFVRKTRRQVTWESHPMAALLAKVPGMADVVHQLFPPQKQVQEKAVAWEGTLATPLNLADWRADPNAACFEDAWFIRRWYEPVWKIKRDYRLTEVSPYHAWQDDFGRQKFESAGIQPSWSLGKQESEGKEQALLMVRYDTFVIEGEVFENSVCITLNDTDILWFGPNPYDHGMKPYVLTPCIPIPGSLYGKSLVKDIIPVAHASDTAATQLLDMMAWFANPPMQKNIEDPTVAALGDIAIKPGLMIPVSLMDSIRPLQLNTGEPAVLAQFLDRLDAVIRESSNTSPAFTGEDPSLQKGHITAFQVGAHIEGGNNRNQIIMSIFDATTLAPFMQMKWENDRQFMTKTYIVPGFEEPLTPDIVRQMEMAWTITASQASLTRAKEVANLKELLTMLPPLEQAGYVKRKAEIGEVDYLGMLKMLLAKVGFPETDRILKIVASAETLPQQSGGVLPGINQGDLHGQPLPGSTGGAPPAIDGVPGIPAVEGENPQIPPA